MDEEEMMEQAAGMSVEAFLQGRLLQRGDIILCRGKKGLTSRLVRWGTESHFSHAALVFAIPHPDEGFDKAFVIESTGEGIDLTDLGHYLNSDHYDIAIRRLEQPWFTERPDLPQKIRGHLLDFINGQYDFTMILRIALSIAYSKYITGKRETYEAMMLRLLEQRRQKNRHINSGFICSGFVQHGYYKTIKAQVERGELPAECLLDVLFHPGETGQSSTPRRLATSPRELAATDKLVWKYASQRVNGVTTLYPIASRAELEALFGTL
jgi:hypothetical protein